MELNLDVKFITYCVMSGFRCEIAKICAFLGYYVAYSGNTDVYGLPSGPMFKGPLKMGANGCPETSLKNYKYTRRNFPEERRS